MKKEPANSV
jgi:hypothetical protein